MYKRQAVYKVVLGREFLDSAKAANVKYEAATFTNYGASESIIDYVFVSKNGFEVEEYSCLLYTSRQHNR